METKRGKGGRKLNRRKLLILLLVIIIVILLIMLYNQDAAKPDSMPATTDTTQVGYLN